MSRRTSLWLRKVSKCLFKVAIFLTQIAHHRLNLYIYILMRLFVLFLELSLGELVHDEMFGLLDAMSAIEMMDPKMDAGMMCNRTSKKILNFGDAVQAGTLKIEDLSFEERIGIVDDTVACLVTWLEGHSLAQTVFTNVYFQSPLEIIDPCLKSFSIVILKIVDLIREFITKPCVYEEEDFQPLVYGYPLCQEISESKACSMLRESEDELFRRAKTSLRSLADRKDGNGRLSDNLENTSEEDLEIEVQFCLALSCRLKFFRLLLASMAGLRKEINSKPSQEARKWTDAGSKRLEDVERQLSQCKESFRKWKETLSLGVVPTDVKVKSSAVGSQENRPDYPTIMGFEPLVNQRLLPPTFPRYTKMRTRQDAVSYVEDLVNRVQNVTKICDCSSFNEALDFFTKFSRLNQQSNCVLSRSILQSLYLRQGNLVLNEMPLIDKLRDSVNQFIRPPAMMPKFQTTDFQQSQEFVDMFFANCCRPMTMLLQINGHNRARQREKLVHALEELSSLQNEAEKLDTYLNRLSQKLETPFSHMGYFSTWAIFHILRVMIQYLLSGFELELYSAHEYPYIFWYLYEFLYGWMCSTLNRAITLQDSSVGEYFERCDFFLSFLRKLSANSFFRYARI